MAQTLNDYRNFLIKYEGKINKPIHKDSEIIVGIGHNLLGNSTIKPYYTDREVDAFFAADLAGALKAAKKSITNFEKQPYNAKLIIISLIFTCGPQGFEKFVKFRLAMEQSSYKTAARELENSKWARQVGGNRVNNHVKILENLQNLQN